MIYIALLAYAGQVWLIHTLTTPIEASHHIINVYQHTFLDITPILPWNCLQFTTFPFLHICQCNLIHPGGYLLAKAMPAKLLGIFRVLPPPPVHHCYLSLACPTVTCAYYTLEVELTAGRITFCVLVLVYGWILQNQSPSLDIKGNNDASY